MMRKKQKEKEQIPAPATGSQLLSARYDALAAGGKIKDDPAQKSVLAVLQALADRLKALPAPARRGFSLFKKAAAPEPARSVYIWGNVGRGKSMLMDLFFDAAAVEKKRRVHFHAFMQEVHARIHSLRQNPAQSKSGADPVIVLAQQIAQETQLLCFDELQATDVADATLLYRLFLQLFGEGVIIVSTSNHPPASLYTGGVQRERFAKFITLIEERMQVVSLSSPLDYRHVQIKSLREIYHTPLSSAPAFLAEIIQHICTDPKPKAGSLEIHGRTLAFALYDQSIGRFTFRELCETALGPADYLAIAARLDTVILTDIPKLPTEKRNEAKRFVTLIDALYEHKVKLLCTAEVPPEAIYSEGDGAFEFARTVSRLSEMQSAKWMDDD